MAEHCHYADVIDTAIYSTAMLHQSYAQNQGSTSYGTASIDKLVGDKIAAAFEEHKRIFLDSLAHTIEELQKLRPVFQPGERVLIVWSAENIHGDAGIVLEVNGTVFPVNYAVGREGDKSITGVGHDKLRPSYFERIDGVRPERSAYYTEDTDPEKIRLADRFWKSLHMLHETLRGARQIKKYSDQETEEQKKNAENTRKQLVADAWKGFEDIEVELRDQGIIYVHGRFLKVIHA